MDRLILALISLSLRSPIAGAEHGSARAGVLRVFETALQILCEPSSCSPAAVPEISRHLPRVLLALRILLAIPGELEAADMPKSQVRPAAHLYLM